MARDTELDMLKADMDAAFEQMKAARGLMNAAWERKGNLRDQMNEAFACMNSLRGDMESAWQSLQNARSRQNHIWESMDHGDSDEYERLTKQIDAARANADSAHSRASDAFDSSRRAYENHNGVSAKAYSEEGHRLMDECRQYNAEFQGLVERRREVAHGQKAAGLELRNAKAETDDYRSEHERLHSEFVSAKTQWQSLRKQYEEAKAECQRLRDSHRSLKSDFDQKHEAYIQRRNVVQSRRDQRHESDREIARKAGVPAQYLDDVLVKRDTNGTINIYFGGYGAPDGPGHGHRCVNSSGRVIYDRQPGEAHGAQNFTNASQQEAVSKSSMGSVVYKNMSDYTSINPAFDRGTVHGLAYCAMARSFANANSDKRVVVYEDDRVKVSVRGSHNVKYGCPVTDTLIYDKSDKKQHYHVVMSDEGEVLLSEWRDNKSPKPKWMPF